VSNGPYGPSDSGGSALKYPIHGEYRRGRSRRQRTLVVGCILVAVCCFTPIFSESKAQNGTGEKESQKDSWRRIGSSVSETGDDTTKITVMGGSVFVPVTLVYKSNEMDVQLLLDTGSSRTVVSTEIADRLEINPTEGRKVRVQVVGGAVIEARQVRLTSITVGPHTKKETDILILEHRGPPVKYDGLLGMDLLRGLKYNIDFEKQIITWE
jgi:predicted aspartyl protease